MSFGLRQHDHSKGYGRSTISTRRLCALILCLRYLTCLLQIHSFVGRQSTVAVCCFCHFDSISLPLSFKRVEASLRKLLVLSSCNLLLLFKHYIL